MSDVTTASHKTNIYILAILNKKSIDYRWVYSLKVWENAIKSTSLPLKRPYINFFMRIGYQFEWSTEWKTILTSRSLCSSSVSRLESMAARQKTETERKRQTQREAEYFRELGFSAALNPLFWNTPAPPHISKIPEMPLPRISKIPEIPPPQFSKFPKYPSLEREKNTLVPPFLYNFIFFFSSLFPSFFSGGDAWLHNNHKALSRIPNTA